MESMIDKIIRAAEARPESQAVEISGLRVSYDELRSKILFFSELLEKAGVVAGDAVVFSEKRSLNDLYLMLGTLKLGAFYVPLAKDVDELVLETVIRALKPKIRIACSNRFFGSLEYVEYGGSINHIPNKFMYMLMTSGSTKKPKCVMVGNGSVASMFDDANKNFQFKSSQVWSQCHNFSFGFSLWEIFASLCYGGTLVFLDQAEWKSSEQFWKKVVSSGISEISLTPSRLDYLLPESAIEFGSIKGNIYLSGEPMNFDALMRAKPMLGDHFELINLYALTETAGPIGYTLLWDIENEAEIGLIARVFQSSKLELIGDGLKVLSVAGECTNNRYLFEEEQDGFSRGCKDSTLNSRFITGDIGHYDSRNRLILDGRNKGFIKIGAVRTSFSSVMESLKSKYPIDWVSIIRDEAGRLIISYTSSNGKYLLTGGSELLIPPGSIILRLQEIPLNNSGKFDAKFILEQVRNSELKAMMGPKTFIRYLCRDLVGSQVSTDLSFFEMGMNSMDLLFVKDRIHSYFMHSIPLWMFFKYPTIDLFSEALERMIEEGLSVVSQTA